ncbi:TPA: hypothetical protein ACH3X2_004339 [Trebouxia sp. C0005]
MPAWHTHVYKGMHTHVYCTESLAAGELQADCSMTLTYPQAMENASLRSLHKHKDYWDRIFAIGPTTKDSVAGRVALRPKGFTLAGFRVPAGSTNCYHPS